MQITCDKIKYLQLINAFVINNKLRILKNDEIIKKYLLDTVLLY